MNIISVNPANGQVIQSYQTHNKEEVSTIIADTQHAWEKWKETPFSLRGKLLHAVAKILRTRKEDLSVLMALEMGKPLEGGRAEIEKCADVCEY